MELTPQKVRQDLISLNLDDKAVAKIIDYAKDYYDQGFSDGDDQREDSDEVPELTELEEEKIGVAYFLEQLKDCDDWAAKYKEVERRSFNFM